MMKKNAAVLLAALLTTVSLCGCGNTEPSKYASVKLEGHNFNLTKDMESVASEMYSYNLHPYDYVHSVLLDDEGKQSNSGIDTLESRDNTVSMGLLKKTTMNVKKPINCNEYVFSKEYTPEIKLFDNIGFETSEETLLQSGFVDCGQYKVLLWADNEIVSLPTYKSKASDYLSASEGVMNFMTYLTEKNYVKDLDSYLTFTSASSVVMEATNSYEQLIASVDGAAITPDEQLLNAYSLIFASLSLGEEYKDGKISDFGALMISEDRIIVTIAQ